MQIQAEENQFSSAGDQLIISPGQRRRDQMTTVGQITDSRTEESVSDTRSVNRTRKKSEKVTYYILHYQYLLFKYKLG